MPISRRAVHAGQQTYKWTSFPCPAINGRQASTRDWGCIAWCDATRVRLSSLNMPVPDFIKICLGAGLPCMGDLGPSIGPLCRCQRVRAKKRNLAVAAGIVRHLPQRSHRIQDCSSLCVCRVTVAEQPRQVCSEDWPRLVHSPQAVHCSQRSALSASSCSSLHKQQVNFVQPGERHLN